MREKSEEEINAMKAKLTDNGFEELASKEEVDRFLEQPGTALVVVNSVCGCAGPAIRKGVIAALDRDFDIDHRGTVFAGIDDEATEEVRSRAPESEPSSPSIYLFQDGEPIKYIPRKFTMKHQYDETKVTEELLDLYNTQLAS